MRGVRRRARRHLAALVGLAAVAAAAVAAVALPGGAQAIRPVPCAGERMEHVTVAPVLNRAFNNHSVQVGANCDSWQDFIYLNWPARTGSVGRPSSAPATALGRPGAQRPTVWQSYPEASRVFADPARALTVPDTALPRLDEFQQTGGGWLTSVSGKPVYYEVRLNPDMVQWIAENHLDTRAGQVACARAAGGFNLPHGGPAPGAAGMPDTGPDTNCAGAVRTYGLNVGSILVKAAWMELPADGSLDSRYLTERARLVDPATGSEHVATVGLVGFHIARKQPGAEKLIWATFEQIDNVPDDPGGTRPRLPANAPAEAAERSSYAFFDPACRPAASANRCVANAATGVACVKGAAPAGCHAVSLPVQVTRLTPIGGEADEATADAWGAIARAQAPGAIDSVLRYYRLVDVQWPADDVAPLAPGATAPLGVADLIPAKSTRIVANSTIETFVQSRQTCMDCHAQAAIATPDTVAAALRTPAAVRARLRAPQLASDFTFVFAVETRR